MLSTPFAVMALAIFVFTSLSARGGFGDERSEQNRPAQSYNRPAYNTQNKINQVPGGRAVEESALYNRGLENGAGGGTVYQQAPAQPSYPTPSPAQIPY